MIIVTGGAGFIGANIVKGLNARGVANIMVVDDLTHGAKFANLADCEIQDYLDKDAFLARVRSGERLADNLEAVFHQGACATTTEWDGRFMLENNYEYSKALLQYCLARRVPFLYASSASVYGLGPEFSEDRRCERPLNVYAYSKFLFDQYVRQLPPIESQVAGLRYFNVYGPREQHKGAMASVAYHLNRRVLETGKARLFQGSDGYADGEQRRDFIYVGDVVGVNLWLLDNRHVTGVFNLGTGRSQTFNDVARAVIACHGRGEIEYIPFPESLRGRYQSYTQANMTRLIDAGLQHRFKTVEEGVPLYLQALAKAEPLAS